MEKKTDNFIDLLRPAGSQNIAEDLGPIRLGPNEKEALKQVLAYHQATKHHFYAFAAGPRRLDWNTQPDPFRRYRGAPLLELEKLPPKDSPPYYDVAFHRGQIPPAPLNRLTVSQLFFDSLAISAWKQAGPATWALRVNPSSGNLHPTEGYLICGPVEGLNDKPMVCHYAPREHLLEQRAQFSLESWQALTKDLPAGALLVGLTSIHWREAWKYGERAFRYCQHDVGHALAALSLAVASLGWQAVLLDDHSTEQIGTLLGTGDSHGAEAEHPDCLLAVYPQDKKYQPGSLPAEAITALTHLSWQGRPNQLSSGHVEWPIIDKVAAASRKPPTFLAGADSPPAPAGPPSAGPDLTAVSPARAVFLRPTVHQRRSAVAMDGRTAVNRDVFYRMLSQTLPAPDRFPFNLWPWPPFVHLALFVHRVNNLPPGLYLLIRDPAQEKRLRSTLKQGFEWIRPGGCPDHLNLHRLASGDSRAVAGQLSCQQAIAADGCFSLGMLTDLAQPLLRHGAWFYPRLFWECGMIGQMLYLEAEAAGIRATGIGCFFDDPVHELLGLEDMSFQSLYHFTVGGPVEDTRLTTLPAYPAD